MTNEGPITRDEMIELFGEEMPAEAVQILWNAPDDWTIGMVRQQVRALGNQRCREIAASVRASLRN